MRIINLGCVLAAWIGTSCGESRSPLLCVFAAADAPNPDIVTVKTCPSRKTFAAGEVIYVLHELDPSATVDAPVSIEVATPCSALTSEHEYDATNRARAAVVAPAGAECSLQVTATVLNETARFASAPDPKSCKIACPDGGAQ